MCIVSHFIFSNYIRKEDKKKIKYLEIYKNKFTYEN